MRYSTEPRFRKYVKGYGFFSFARTFGDKYGKKLIDAAKTRIDAAKTVLKRVVQKTAETTGDLTRTKIADKIISVAKSKEKQAKQRKIIFHYKKENKLLMNLNCFERKIKCKPIV